jgi:hypothetical protein
MDALPHILREHERVRDELRRADPRRGPHLHHRLTTQDG